jgi:hypothetical protein
LAKHTSGRKPTFSLRRNLPDELGRKLLDA